MRGEELALVRQLLARGHDGWWVPGAAVRHFIPAERMTVAYVRRYSMGDGEFQAMTQPDAGGHDTDGPMVFGRPRQLWRRALGGEIRYRWTRLFSPSEVWVRYLVSASRAWGSLRALGRRGKPAAG